MYQVTETFRRAMNNFVIMPVLRGTVGNKAFTHDDILQDTFRVCNQCIAVNDAKLGGVFIGELRLTFLSTVADRRGDWVGKVISCEYGLVTEEGAEYIPTPSKYYTIYSADWTEQGLKVIAYDNMIKLNKDFAKEQSAGTAWEWLQYISVKTGIAIGQTQAEVNALPNALKQLGLINADNVETYRDLVSYLAASLSGFATINREGALIIKQFNGSVVATIDPDNRFTGCTFSDYSTRYTGLSVLNSENGTTSYYHLNPDNGLTMKMGANPFLQLGINQDEIRSTILNELWRYNYVPFKATLLGCCAYDLGDLIRFTGGVASNSIGCIMAYDFGLNSYSVACYGDNPALENVQTKTEKNITGLTKSKAKEELSITSLTNISTVEISEDWAEIGKLSFAVSKDQTMLFHGVSKTSLTVPGVVQYKYVLNDEALDFIHEEYSNEGNDTQTLFIPFTVSADVPNTLRIYTRSENAAGEVLALNMRGSILGVGISTNDWDGTLSFNDFYNFTLNGGLITNFTDGGVTFAEDTPTRHELTDVYLFDTCGLLDVNFSDTLKITLHEPEFSRTTEDGDRRLTEENDTRIT